MIDSPAEAIAKSAVVDFIRRSRRTTSMKTISELPLPQFGVRADLVICGHRPTAIEIKTARDSLTRLDRQSRALCHAFPTVYFAVSPNHLPKVLLHSAAGVGVLVVEEGKASLVRKASASASYSPAIAIEIIPTKLLAKWLHRPVRTGRADLIAALRGRSEADQRRAIRWFLDEKWSLLSISDQKTSSCVAEAPGSKNLSRAIDYYGRDFGVVPDYLRLRVRA